MRRDLLQWDRDEDAHRYPWDGPSLDPIYVGHATSSEVEPVERAIPLLQGPRGLSAGRLLHAEGGTFTKYPAATNAISRDPHESTRADVRHLPAPIFLEPSSSQGWWPPLRAQAHFLRLAVGLNESTLPRTPHCGRPSDVLAGYCREDPKCGCVHELGAIGLAEAAATIGVPSSIDVDVVIDQDGSYHEGRNDDSRLHVLHAFGFFPHGDSENTTTCAHCGASRRPPADPELSPIARLARDGVPVRIRL